MTAYPVSTTDTVQCGYMGGPDNAGWNAFAGLLVRLSTGVVARGYGIPTYRAVADQADLVYAREAAGVLATYHTTLAERGIKARATALIQLAYTLHDTLKMRDATIASLMLRVVEAVGISAVLVPQLKTSAQVSEAVKLVDDILAQLGLALFDHFAVESAASVLRAAVAAVADELMIEDEAGPTLRSIAVVQDGVDLDDEAAVQVAYTAMLSEGVVLCQLGEPGGGITAWAMNARTGALSEYRNYAFNSFAAHAGGYLAAGPSGVYELRGATDAGAPIVATLRNGIMELAGSHLAGLKAVYIAARGGGTFYLRLESSGRTVVYQADAANMRSARIDVGNGWRARYMTWELTSTGQDFVLDDLEFLPITFTRRV